MITGWPSFPTYVSDAAKQEAVVKLAPLSDGAFDLDAIAELIGPRTRLIWVCTPNNPTGGVVTRADFRRFVDTVPESVLVVVDEAYHEFAAGPEQLDCIARVRSRAAQRRGAEDLLQALRTRRTAGRIPGRAREHRHRGRQEPSLLRPDRTVRRRGAREPRQSRRGASAAAASTRSSGPRSRQRCPSTDGTHTRRTRISSPSKSATPTRPPGDCWRQESRRARSAGWVRRSCCGSRSGPMPSVARLVEVLGRAGVPARCLIRQLDRARITELAREAGRDRQQLLRRRFDTLDEPVAGR